MLRISPTLVVDRKELIYEFVRASGPGGQNINKVATAVQLRLDVRNSPSLPAEVKERLVRLAGRRMTDDGLLIIEAKRYRTQEQNRQDAEARLVSLIQMALVKPKKRRPTQPSTTADAKRIDMKKRRGTIKRLRRAPSDHDN